MPCAFFLYRDSPLRREALRLAPGAGERYSLYGLDEIEAAGLRVEHNLEPGDEPGGASRTTGRLLNRAVLAAGGYGGDFATVLACRRRLRDADVVFSTVDTVGIPLALLLRGARVRTPMVYAAIGLPERLEELRTGVARRTFERSFRRLHTLVAYGWGEVDALRAWLGDAGPQIAFVPFGVDTEYFRPEPSRPPDADVVSIGADPRRDVDLLLELARGLPDRSFRVVVSGDRAQTLGEVTSNVSVEADIPFPVVRDRRAGARVIVLPVRDNSDTGATTTLLQAMASGKPVVVSRTAAIARGYHLEDGVNCRLVPPGDLAALQHAVSDLLADSEQAAALGVRARETVERHLTWRHYTEAVRGHLLAAAGASTVRA
jgi:glycosyltransferase involved in cell wall biosynthesis